MTLLVSLEDIVKIVLAKAGVFEKNIKGWGGIVIFAGFKPSAHYGI